MIGQGFHEPRREEKCKLQVKVPNEYEVDWDFYPNT
jgi:hypothetical protein